MYKREKEKSLKENFVSKTLLPFFILILAALLVPSHVFGEGEYDINSPLVETIANKLSMDGHEEHDLATCTTKVRYYEEVSELLNEGYNSDEVIDYYVDMYGEQGLRAPNKSGFSLLAWTLPFVAMGVVGVGLFTTLRKKMKTNKVIYEDELSSDETEDEIISTYIDDERKKYF